MPTTVTGSRPVDLPARRYHRRSRCARRSPAPPESMVVPLHGDTVDRRPMHRSSPHLGGRIVGRQTPVTVRANTLDRTGRQRIDAVGDAGTRRSPPRTIRRRGSTGRRTRTMPEIGSLYGLVTVTSMRTPSSRPGSPKGVSEADSERLPGGVTVVLTPCWSARWRVDGQRTRCTGRLWRTCGPGPAPTDDVPSPKFQSHDVICRSDSVWSVKVTGVVVDTDGVRKAGIRARLEQDGRLELHAFPLGIAGAPQL